MPQLSDEKNLKKKVSESKWGRHQRIIVSCLTKIEAFTITYSGTLIDLVFPVFKSYKVCIS